jgi:CPA1 family monovalent cation:H+ antiporter
MNLFSSFAVLLVISAVFSYLNYKYLKFPFTIGIMIISLITSLGIISFGNIFPELYTRSISMVGSFDFQALLMNVMLSFLLFAGAINVDSRSLREERLPVLILATAGVIISTFIVGTLTFYMLKLFSLNISYLHCLLFGALISPTDPIAVMGILKQAGLPRSLEIKITGESLLNDGVSVVVFITLYQISMIGIEHMNVLDIGLLFLEEAGGGILFGFILGNLGYLLLKSIDNYQIEVLITLAIVTGGYSLANALHISGPLSIVIAGIIIGNKGRELAMSQITREYVYKFWEIIDIILNAILFILIGFEILVLNINLYYFGIGLLAVIIVLFARTVSVGAPAYLLQYWKTFTRNEVKILTWGGLRGGISIALALSLTDNMQKVLFVGITYTVILFSILVQGLTIGKVVQRLTIPANTEPAKDYSVNKL